MDDIGEIITIAIFILISLFSSIMNKKKKAAEKAKKQLDPANSRNNADDNMEVKKPSNPFEIFAKKVENKVSEVDEYFATLEQSTTRQEKNPQPKPKVTTEYIKPVKSKTLISPTIFSKRTKIQKEKIIKRDKTVSELKRKFQNPQSIREYVIANEIFNKPKALE